MPEVNVPIPDTSVPGVAEDFHNPDFIIRFRGTVDFDSLYKLTTKWIKRRKFVLYELLQKFKPPEIEIKLSGRRKKTGYKRERIDVNFHMFKNKEVEVLEGKKVVKMMDVRMKITFKSFIETGYANIFGWKRWQTSKVNMVLQNLLNKFIIKKEIDMVDSDTLYYELYELQSKIKEFLKMEARGNAY